MQNIANTDVLARNKNCCTFCPGYCCYRLSGSFLLVTAEDINRIALHFSMNDGDVRHRFMENNNTFRTREDGSYLFLAQGKMSKRCTIHEVQPRQYDEFPYKKLAHILKMLSGWISSSQGLNKPSWVHRPWGRLFPEEPRARDLFV